MKKLLTLGICLLAASPAMAGFTATGVGPYDSNGGQDDAVLNGSFTYAYGGPDFYVGDLIFSGDVTSGDIGSYLTELVVQIEDPSGDSAWFFPFASGNDWTGTQSAGPLTISGAGEYLAGTAGTYVFSFWEDYDDTSADSTLVDAYW